MIKKIKTYLAVVLASIGTALVFATPVATAQVGCGADTTKDFTSCTTADDKTADTSADTKVNNLIRRAVQVFQIVVGLISVFMVIMGGLKYITSGGDSGKVGEAKNAILYAVIGLVIVGVAQVIVQFALNRAANSGSSTL
jgi:cytochrome bd-type quinol oxidase subunit 2